MLDEPTAALGVAQTAEVLDLIERVRERGLGVVMISHNMEDVRAVADRIVVLRLGRNNGVFDADASNESWSARSPAPATTPCRAAPPGGPRADRAGGHVMTGDRTSAPAGPQPLLDRSDNRLERRQAGVAGAVRAFGRRVRAGDLGALPVVVGLVVIWTVFESSTASSCPADNLVNLLFDCCAVGVIALGIVCVLMVGEIDLSVGSVSGLASAARRAVGQPRLAGGHWPCWSRCARGAVDRPGLRQLFNRFGMPSFVATLAGPARLPRPAAEPAGQGRARSTCPTGRPS